MENSTPFECTISTTNPSVELSLQILIDDTVIYENKHVTETVNFKYDLPDDEKDHELFFKMSGKNANHTVVDEQGNIIKDAMLSISDIKFDEIDLTMVVISNAVYTHDFNGTQNTIKDKFYGDMGCNGTIGLKFSSPIYLWLLENL